MMDRHPSAESTKHRDEERIVNLWTEDPEFLDPTTGWPAHLRKYGSGGSFRTLVNRAARGVTPKTATDSLSNACVLKPIGDSWVELLDPDWKAPLSEAQLDAMRKLLAGKWR